MWNSCRSWGREANVRHRKRVRLVHVRRKLLRLLIWAVRPWLVSLPFRLFVPVWRIRSVLHRGVGWAPWNSYVRYLSSNCFRKSPFRLCLLRSGGGNARRSILQKVSCRSIHPCSTKSNRTTSLILCPTYVRNGLWFLPGKTLRWYLHVLLRSCRLPSSS